MSEVKQNQKYKPTIGLEIHAELNTETKMFCSSKNDPEETRPNVNICPICMAHPGTLPTINKEAVKKVLMVGTAVNGNLADFTEFDRKNYFYPDIPKGYQISQYEHPLVSGGELAGVLLTRIHLEEDTARSVHSSQVPGAEAGENYSLVNFNRAGVPLMELVTEPVIETGEQASFFAKELQLLLKYLNVGEANMEKGEMRVEANISISPNESLGSKVEVKNLNSFRSVARAIDYEIKRQTEIIEKGEKVLQETRGWDENKQKTVSQRLKEEAHDYRYFPEPDLPKLIISEIPEFSLQNLQKEIPLLPQQKREKYKEEFKLTSEEAEVFVNNPDLGAFFENTIPYLENNTDKIKSAVNYIISDLNGLLKNAGMELKNAAIKPEDFAEIINMNYKEEISSRGAKNLLEKIFAEGGNPQEIAQREGYIQKSDEGELESVVEEIIKENPQPAEQFKAGKEESLKFLIGQGMKKTGGSANPQVLEEILRRKFEN